MGFVCSPRHVRHNVKGAGDDIHKQLVAGAGGQLEFVIALARQIESGHTYQGNEGDSLLMSDPYVGSVSDTMPDSICLARAITNSSWPLVPATNCL